MLSTAAEYEAQIAEVTQRISQYGRQIIEQKAIQMTLDDLLAQQSPSGQSVTSRSMSSSSRTHTESSVCSTLLMDEYASIQHYMQHQRHQAPIEQYTNPRSYWRPQEGLAGPKYFTDIHNVVEYSFAKKCEGNSLRQSRRRTAIFNKAKKNEMKEDLQPRFQKGRLTAESPKQNLPKNIINIAPQLSQAYDRLFGPKQLQHTQLGLNRFHSAFRMERREIGSLASRLTKRRLRCSRLIGQINIEKKAMAYY